MMDLCLSNNQHKNDKAKLLTRQNKPSPSQVPSQHDSARSIKGIINLDCPYSQFDYYKHLNPSLIIYELIKKKRN